MLILLAPNFLDALQALKSDPVLLDCLDNLAISARKGLHIVSGPLRVLDAIIGILSGDAKGTFRVLRQRHHEMNALRELVTDVVVVEPRISGLVARSGSSSGPTEHRVPYSFFSSLDSIQPARLVAEDADDAILLERVGAAHLFATRQSRGVCLRLHGFGGGGSSTADQFSAHAKQGPTLCVVDSDRRHPAAPEGQTAKLVRTAERALSPTRVVRVHVLSAREIENLLPAAAIHDSLGPEDGELRGRCNGAQSLGLLDSGPGGRFIDLKHGVRGYDLHVAGLAERKLMEETLPATGLCHDCATTPNCAGRDSCNCVLFSGLGGSVLGKVAAHVEKLSPQKAAEVFLSSTCRSANEWRLVASQVVSWGISYPPIRA